MTSLTKRWEELGRPLVFGHRGATAGRTKDNTLEAFAAARDTGADGIEFDIRLTKDNVMIIHHDDSARGFGPFRRKSFAELRAQDPSVPTIDELLEVSGDMYLNAELKNSPKDKDHDPRHRVTRLLAKWAKNNDVEERVLATSFNGETTDQMRFADRDIATGRLIDPRDDPAEYVRYLGARGHSWIMPNKRHLRRNGAAFVASAHRNGMEVGVWTLNSKASFQAAAEMGVALVITDEPAKALRVYS
jgi:glycerophosphoryl diester phosphodiesterase